MRGLIALALSTALMASSAALAEEKPVLTVYTYDSFTADWGPGPKVEEAFEKICNCDLKWVALADGVALLNRLKLEGENSKADLVLGLDTSLTVAAAETGLFAPAEIDTSAINIPGDFASDTFVPYDYAHFAVIYDTESGVEPPKSLAELVDGRGGGKIAIQDPRTSTPGLGLLLWMKAVYGDDAPAAWEKLKPRVLTVTPGWSEAYGLFTKGEAEMVLSYTTSPAYHVIAEETDRYKALKFPEGHTLQIEVAGRLKAAQQPALAKDFLQFITTPAFQDIIPTNNWMRPAAATSEALPEAFNNLVQPETLSISAEDVAKNRKAWVDEWLKAMSR